MKFMICGKDYLNTRPRWANNLNERSCVTIIINWCVASEQFVGCERAKEILFLSTLLSDTRYVQWISMCFNHKPCNIYESDKIYERSLSYFRVVLSLTLFENEFRCTSFHTELSFFYKTCTMDFQGTWKVMNQDLLWNRGTKHHLQTDSLV